MNRALWSKAFRDAALLLAGCTLLMYAFAWTFVWISSLVKLDAMLAILQFLPDSLQGVFGVKPTEIASPAGRIALAFVDPVVLLVSAVWAIARGSDSVSGQLERGTLEMVLAQPVTRFAVLWTHCTVTLLGAVLIAVAAYLGTWTGLTLVDLGEGVYVEPRLYLLPAVNLFSLTCFLAGCTTLVSSCDRFRWRSIGLMGSFYILQMVIKLIGRMAPGYDWMIACSFLGAYEPQKMVSQPDLAWEMSLQFNLALLIPATVAYILATVIFCRRDLPAPV